MIWAEVQSVAERRSLRTGRSGKIVRLSRKVLPVLLVAWPAAIVPIALGSSASADRVPTRGPWKAEGNQASAHFGTSVATAGDVNGDGFADVIVGAQDYDNGQADEGRAFVYHGSASGLSATPDWTAESDQVFAFFGWSVGTAGDVNGDGYADVIVGAYGYDNGQTDEARAYVYHGSASGLSATPDWTAESDQANGFLGVSVGTAGDVNGDGYADVIVGASNYDNGQADEGRAFAYHGSADGLSSIANWTAGSDQASAHFGNSVGAAGDTNADGYADVIVGAYGDDNGQADEGRAFVYHGSTGGLSSTPNWTATSHRAFVYFGWSVGTAGDVNGDGYADVIVGAYQYDSEGRAYVYHGSASGLSATPDWTAESDHGQANGFLGVSVGTAGDVNGDGFADVFVGAAHYDNGQADEGVAFTYQGASAGLSITASRRAESDQAFARFGWSVGTAGDVNEDGYADAIVGAYCYDHGHTDEGVVLVWSGRA
jgi:hypothetical protein